MRAMILAAGLGTRLAPITDYLPKPLLPVVGVPNIVRTIRRLRAAGIVDMVINTHAFPERLRATLGDGRSFGVTVAYSDEPVLLGTGGGIRNALDLLGDDDFVVFNGDALFSPDLGAAIAFHRRTGALATMIVRSDPDAAQYGAVGVDGTNRVRRLVFGGEDRPDLRYFMFTGVHIVSRRLGDRLPAAGCIVRETYIPMVREGAPIYALPMAGYFCDIGTKARYLDANIRLVDGRAEMPDIEAPATGYFIAKSARLGPGAVVEPGSVICDDAVIEKGVRIRRAVVLGGAVVSEDVADAIVVPNGHIIPCDTEA